MFIETTGINCGIYDNLNWYTDNEIGLYSTTVKQNEKLLHDHMSHYSQIFNCLPSSLLQEQVNWSLIECKFKATLKKKELKWKIIR